MWTFPCRPANRADGLSSPASMAATCRSLCLVHKGMSYQSWAQPPSMISFWCLTSNVSVGALLQNAAWQKQRCGKPATQQCTVGRSRFSTERRTEGVSWEVGGGNQEGKPHVVRSEATVEDLEGNGNGAGVQEMLGGQNLVQRCGQKGRAGQCFWKQTVKMVIAYGRDRDQKKRGWFWRNTSDCGYRRKENARSKLVYEDQSGAP